LVEHRRDLEFYSPPAGDGRERRAVRHAHAPSLSTRKKERRIRRRERREQRSEEFRLREQQGLSSLGTSEYSSSDEEESDRGRAPPERWEPSPPSPRAAEAAEETVPGAGAGAPAAKQPMREATRGAEAPARAAEMAGGAAATTPAVATTSAEPLRKRKRGFSTLR
jgi:hypothetical protein